MREASRTRLRNQAGLISRYLVGMEPSEAVLDGYVDACGRLLGEVDTTLEDPLVSFAERHPRSLPLLDAAVAWSGSTELLRRKILLVLALLETRPEQVDAFAADLGPTRVVPRLAVLAAGAALRTGLGRLLVRRIR